MWPPEIVSDGTPVDDAHSVPICDAVCLSTPAPDALDDGYELDNAPVKLNET